MNRFPRKGDFVRFRNGFSTNLRDQFGGYNNYVTFAPNNIMQILGIEIHAHAANNSGYSYGTLNLIPYSLILGINDTSISPDPIIVNVSYENIKGQVEYIPGDNPQAVEILYGRSS